MERVHGSTISTQAMITDAPHSSHLGDVSVPGVLSTTLPIREQFRCKRFWFFYHDLRAFTTSWLPLPIFLAYRILVFLYVLVWLILHIVFRADEFGPHWLIFVTDLAYAVLMFAMGALAILCAAYTIVYYRNEQCIRKYIPKRDFPVVRIFKQDNTPFAVKVVWWLYITATVNAVMVFLGYWGFIYSPCEGSGEGSGMPTNSSSGSGMEVGCSVLDVHTVQVHGINLVIVLLDLLVSRIPYQLLHFFYPSVSFSIPYVLFSLIYWGADGTNHIGQPYIYSTLDYASNPLAAFYAIVVAFAPMILHVVLFFFAWLRDVIYVHVGCCFRDVKELPYRDAEGQEVNGVGSEEMTKV